MPVKPVKPQKFWELPLGASFELEDEAYIKTGDETANRKNPPHDRVFVNNDDTVERGEPPEG